MAAIVLGLLYLSLAIWLFMLIFWGQFWRVDQQLETATMESIGQVSSPSSFPSVSLVIPARNEALLLPVTMRSLLLQDYPGTFNIFLVDDQSTDGTAEYALGVAHAVDKPEKLHIISSESLPQGWTGKLWAMEQGVNQSLEILQSKSLPKPDYFLLTDADIEHDPSNLQRLVTKAVQEDLDLVSIMVKLRCKSFWEKLLIPAFVFFFQKLYPFRWVNNPKKSLAAAAGGCILIRRDILEHIGGLSVIRHALIDDCTLAKAVKSEHGRIWLGLSNSTQSLRPYDTLKTIWDMVARSAYTQLNYSPMLLVGSVLGMTLIYLLPPISIILGFVLGNWAIALLGLAIWLLMSTAYFPIIRFYQCSPTFALSLPIIAFLYTLMTVDSAMRHWQGRGGAWKGRVYQ